MKMPIIKKAMLWCVGLVSLPVYAQEAQEWFPSARARSLGMALSAWVDDHDSIHINPAGLAHVEDPSWRGPDLLSLAFSRGFLDFYKEIRDLGDSDQSVSEQLQGFDGTNVGLEWSLLGVSYVRHRLGFAVNPMGVYGSARLRTPSLLFARLALRAGMQGGASMAYAHPFYENRLRIGVSFRPFAYRMGLDAILENQDIAEIAQNFSDFSGAGWGMDFDWGVQGDLPPWNLGPDTDLLISSGLVLQNTFGSTFPFRLVSGIDGRPPPMPRRLNFGVAAKLKNAGIIEPTLAVEGRDFLSGYDDWGSLLHIALELKIQPRDFYTTAARFHLAKGNVGGGLGFQWHFVDLEFGTYAVNLGPGPGLSVDRRYYAQLSFLY